MLAVLLFVFQLGQVLAHVELSSPFPFRSRFDPMNLISQNIDYSMTSPLSDDGSNFPCKGYTSDMASSPIKATLIAGGTLPISLSGSATHNGGSCEFAVSYDQGKTWAVIYRVVGACPLTPNYTIQIPSSLPGSRKALLAWLWVNHTGNRELYMNCVPVAIENKDSSIRSYTAPSIFRVNSLPDRTCVTGEGFDVQYPHVNAVKTEFAGGLSASSPVTEVANCPVELSKMITVTSDGSAVDAPGGAPDDTSISSVEKETSTQVVPPAKTTTIATTSKAASPIGKPTRSIKIRTQTRSFIRRPQTTSEVIDTQAVEPSQPTRVAGGCVAGTIKCSADGRNWSMCTNGIYLDMNGVAEGMICKKGAMLRDPAFARLRHRSMKRRSL